MSKGRILVVEDDFDISNMLRIYFTGQGYEVQVAPRGSDALAMTRKQLPELIMLDIMLPDMNGYDVCKELRTTARTRHVPIIFLTQKDERSDKIIGLEMGADDYVTKPFDIEELKLRVQNTINTAKLIASKDAKSGLPTGALIEDHLRSLMRSSQPWTYIDIKINNFDPFRDMYGFVAGDEVIRFMAVLLGEAIDEMGTADDYAGHPGRAGEVQEEVRPPLHAPCRRGPQGLRRLRRLGGKEHVRQAVHGSGALHLPDRRGGNDQKDLPQSEARRPRRGSQGRHPRRLTDGR